MPKLTPFGTSGCNANHINAILQATFLLDANLQRAILSHADLQEANLTQANLQDADLGGATLAGAIYEPDLEAVPVVWAFAPALSKQPPHVPARTSYGRRTA